MSYNSKDKYTMYNFRDGNGPVPAYKHPNGGGWVANTAKIHQGAYVGPRAKVYGYAELKERAEVKGTAKVYGNAVIHPAGLVSGDAQVYDSAEVYAGGWVRGYGKVYGFSIVQGEVFGRAVVFDRAVVLGGHVCDHVIVCENAVIYCTGKIGGDITIKGNARITGDTDVFLRWGKDDFVIDGHTVVNNSNWTYFSLAHSYSIKDWTHNEDGIY